MTKETLGQPSTKFKCYLHRNDQLEGRSSAKKQIGLIALRHTCTQSSNRRPSIRVSYKTWRILFITSAVLIPTSQNKEQQSFHFPYNL